MITIFIAFDEESSTFCTKEGGRLLFEKRKRGCTFSFNVKEKVRKRTLLCYIKAGFYVVGYTANYALGLAELCRKPPISTLDKGMAAPVASFMTSMAFGAFPRIDDTSVLSRMARKGSPKGEKNT